MLDSSRASTLEMPWTPDILVTPSDLTVFAKPLPSNQFATLAEGVLGLNTGRLAKGSTGGTFARLQIEPLAAFQTDASKTPGSDGMLQHSVLQRCKVEILRI